MKKTFSLLVLASSLALTACGGTSESSSYTGKHILANGNQYSCPSEDAMKSCTNDTTCKARCNLTYQATTVVNTNTKDACEVNGTTVSGMAGKSCSFVNKSIDADMVITCGNMMQLDGRIGGFNSQGSTYSSGLNLNGYTLQCK